MKKDNSQHRPIVETFRATQDESRILKEGAQSLGTSKSEFIRSLIFGDPGSAPRS